MSNKAIKKIKIMTFVGTRPEIIRLSRTMSLLDDHVDQVIVHTGQNYDYELNDVFWKELELRNPDHFLNADKSSLGATVGDIIKRSEGVLKQENPDAVLVLGDTNSCLAAYMAKRMHIPIFHMEAGNRCYDERVPEETNRRIIDHISDINLVYTEHARRHLLSEGLHHRRIYLTGSPMKEVLDHYKDKIESSDILQRLGLKPNKYFLVSIHREENVDNKIHLDRINCLLNSICDIYQLPLIVSTHPRTRKRLDESGYLRKNNALIQFMKPFGFLDYNKLQMSSKCVISDSGTISEESAILNFPAISLRESMERPEAQDSGSIILTGFEPDIVLTSIELAINEMSINELPFEYTIKNTSERVLKIILGLSTLIKQW